MGDEVVQRLVMARVRRPPGEAAPPQQQEVVVRLPRERVCPADWGEEDAGEAATAVRPLAVQSVAGRALVFWHETSDGAEALADVFHDGCPVLEGTKRTIVKFKSYADGDKRCEASPFCRLHYSSLA
jgi:hypothetical protein